MNNRQFAVQRNLVAVRGVRRQAVWRISRGVCKAAGVTGSEDGRTLRR